MVNSAAEVHLAEAHSWQSMQSSKKFLQISPHAWCCCRYQPSAEHRTRAWPLRWETPFQLRCSKGLCCSAAAGT